MNRRDTRCIFLSVPADLLENIGSMASFIRKYAHENILVLDNNILPYMSKADFDGVSGEFIQSIAEYNTALASTLRDFSPDRVIVTQDVRSEMKAGHYAAVSEISKVNHPGKKQSLDALVASYDQIKAQIESRSDDYSSAGIVYDSFKDILRKLVLDIPGLKDDVVPGKNETDEKMVAYAFAKAVLQVPKDGMSVKKVCFFSTDKHVVNLARELYNVLTAKNIVGDDAKVKEKLAVNNIEVIGFDYGRHLFGAVFDGKQYSIQNMQGAEWVPPERAQFTQEELDKLITHIQRLLLPVEKELGNGKVLAALIAGKGNDILPPIPEAPEAEADEATAEIGAAVEKTEKQAANMPSVALERLYQRLKVNPADLDGAEQSKIEDAIKDYEALIAVYGDLKAPKSKLENELEQIRSKSVVYQVAKLTKDTEALVAEMNEITKDTNYFKSAEKRNKFAELTVQINENTDQLDGLEQSLKQVQSVTALASMSPVEKKLYDAFQAKGLVITEDGVIVNSVQLTEITQRTKAALFPVLAKMQDEVGLERNSNERPATYRIALKHLPYLVRKRGVSD